IKNSVGGRMLNVNQRLQVRGEEIASKVIDGEAIIINLANGIYYSMDKVGGLIWEMVEAGCSLEDTARIVAGRYEVSPEQARKDVEQLVEELLQENLATTSENGTPAMNEKFLEPPQKLPYETPKLNIYRDMGDLLALDPPTPGLGDTPWKDTDEKSFIKA